PATALGTHMREDRGVAPKGSCREVGVEIATPGAQVEILERFPSAGAGAVDENIKATVAGSNLVDPLLQRVDVSDVEPQGIRCADLGCSRFDGSRDVENRHLSAL